MHHRLSINRNMLSTRQHAYTREKPTDTALLSLVESITESLATKEYALAAFLGIEGAFNNVTSETIMKSLYRLGVAEPIRQIIDYILSRRNIISNLGASSSSRFVNRCTPQVGVLSPLLWNLALNDLLLILERQGCKIVAYADDIVIVAQGKLLPTLSDLIHVALHTLNNWTFKSGLSIKPRKTELVLFSRKYKIWPFGDQW